LSQGKKGTGVAGPDPGSPFSPLDSRSRVGKKIRIQDEQPGSYFQSLETVFWIKYLNSLMRIRDPRWKRCGSGMEKSRIITARDYLCLSNAGLEKTRVFKKKPSPVGFFGFFCVFWFFGFFFGFFGFFAQKRGFLGFFQFHEYF
jgi:hypothetical protein